MAGDDECHGLVDELALGHRRAGFLVARIDEHLQEVEVFGLLHGAPLGERTHEFRELAEFVGELEIARRFLGDDVERIAAHLLRQAFEVGAEDRQQHDLERELAHVVGDVDERAFGGLFLPLRDEAFVAGVDELRELGDDAAVERRAASCSAGVSRDRLRSS